MVAPRGPTAEEFRAVRKERFAAAQTNLLTRSMARNAQSPQTSVARRRRCGCNRSWSRQIASVWRSSPRPAAGGRCRAAQAAVQGIAREGQGRLAWAAQDVIQGQQGARLNSTTMTSSALVSTELRGRLHITTAFATVTYSLLICRNARAGAPQRTGQGSWRGRIMPRQLQCRRLPESVGTETAARAEDLGQEVQSDDTAAHQLAPRLDRHALVPLD
jgi:hypothetical protein